MQWGYSISDKPKYLAAATRSEPSYTRYKPPPHLISSDNAPVVVGQDFQSLFEDARFSLWLQLPQFSANGKQLNFFEDLPKFQRRHLIVLKKHKKEKWGIFFLVPIYSLNMPQLPFGWKVAFEVINCPSSSQFYQTLWGVCNNAEPFHMGIVSRLIHSFNSKSGKDPSSPQIQLSNQTKKDAKSNTMKKKNTTHPPLELKLEKKHRLHAIVKTDCSSGRWSSTKKHHPRWDQRHVFNFTTSSGSTRTWLLE